MHRRRSACQRCTARQSRRSHGAGRRFLPRRWTARSRNSNSRSRNDCGGKQHDNDSANECHGDVCCKHSAERLACACALRARGGRRPSLNHAQLQGVHAAVALLLQVLVGFVSAAVGLMPSDATTSLNALVFRIGCGGGWQKKLAGLSFHSFAAFLVWLEELWQKRRTLCSIGVSFCSFWRCACADSLSAL